MSLLGHSLFEDSELRNSKSPEFIVAVVNRLSVSRHDKLSFCKIVSALTMTVLPLG